MTFLFFTDHLNRLLNANAKIACVLADTLAKRGHTVVVCGLNYSPDTAPSESGAAIRSTYKGKCFLSKSKDLLESFVLAHDGPRDEAVRAFSLKHPAAAAAIYLSYTRFSSDRGIVRDAATEIERLHKQYHFDAVIAFYAPFWAAQSLTKASLPGCKKIVYQLDPWGLHELDIASHRNAALRVKHEARVFDKADHIFTTPCLLEQYKHTEVYRRFLPKIIAADFPNIESRSVDDHTSKTSLFADHACINVLFAGMIDDRYRNPLAFLKCIEKLAEQRSDICVHFLGTNLSCILQDYAKQHPQLFVCHKPVPVDQAFAAIRECDFLLNISNTISNMVPSKIFDYFSTGKPIINIQKIENCPAEPYMSRYPLCFNIREFDMPEDCAQQLGAFLTANKGARLDFETVKEIYKTATPEYIAGQIESVMTKK